MRIVTSLCAALAAVTLAAPATAQIFWQSPNVAGAPLVRGEAGIGVTLPDATEAEERANWVWQMRAAMNLASLQCKFDRTLMSEDLYNGVLVNHSTELAGAYETLRNYFKRTTKTPRAAQTALDQYGTKTYSGYSTVGSQLGFCDAASRIGKKAIAATRGSFTIFTVENLRELRGALVLAGEQQFRFSVLRVPMTMVSMDERCWDRRNNYRRDRCALVEV